MSQLPDVRVSRPPPQPAVRAAWQPPTPSSHPPPRGRSAGVASEATSSEQGPPSFDDYDADAELAWLGYVLAKCQPPIAASHGDRNLVK